MLKPLVTRIPDIPMTKTSINDFLSGLSPIAPIITTHPPLMDGPDFSRISRLMMSQLSRPQELRFPDSQYTNSLRISDTCLHKQTAQICVGVFTMEFPDLLSMGLLISRLPMPRSPPCVSTNGRSRSSRRFET
jgi:hypothetical protein